MLQIMLKMNERKEKKGEFTKKNYYYFHKICPFLSFYVFLHTNCKP